jgi:hypothetical protein
MPGGGSRALSAGTGQWLDESLEEYLDQASQQIARRALLDDAIARYPSPSTSHSNLDSPCCTALQGSRHSASTGSTTPDSIMRPNSSSVKQLLIGEARASPTTSSASSPRSGGGYLKRETAVIGQDAFSQLA